MKSLPYLLYKKPITLDELLDKARSEKEENIHIITNYIPILAYPSSKDKSMKVSVNVRYFHEGKIREVHISCGSNIEVLCYKIIKAGFVVKTIRERRFGEKFEKEDEEPEINPNP
jgi:hypothetical protein